MIDTINVNIQYIKELKESLKRDEEVLNKIYEEKIEKIIKDNYECINRNNVDYYEYSNNIRTLIDEIYDEISKLRSFLEYEIIPGYEESTSTIKRYFNTDFNKKVEDLLKVLEDDNK